MFGKTMQVRGNLLELSPALVMGIVNLTPDSFFAASRQLTEASILEKVHQHIAEGADIIDLGGYSSRPGADFVSEEEEKKRLDFGLSIIRRAYPEVLISVDTFRSNIARHCFDKYRIDFVNDISAGVLDGNMFSTIAELKIPYIMMHMRGTVENMMDFTHYEHLFSDIFLYFSKKISELRQMGVSDIILDPGFGFSKTMDQNYILMSKLESFDIFDLPLLIGVSRKKMIRNLLHCEVEDSLSGTTVLHSMALMKGANILRVHDVRAAKEAVLLVHTTKQMEHAN
ncbi:7,8-dihydropteroate synthase [Bacteroidales bacterium]|nr:7,8-dihydropteroate synthase [Bacteroidales bacterium]